MIERVRRAWSEAGRDGTPKFVALAYFSLGDTSEDSRRYLLDYYKLQGPDAAEMTAGSAMHDPKVIKGAIDGFAQAGMDEFILDPTVPDPEQVDLLAEVVF